MGDSVITRKTSIRTALLILATALRAHRLNERPALQRATAKGAGPQEKQEAAQLRALGAASSAGCRLPPLEKGEDGLRIASPILLLRSRPPLCTGR